MKKIFVTQRSDLIGKFNEKRDNLDIRFSVIFEKLNMIPIFIPNNLSLARKIIKNIKPNGIILSPGGDALKKDSRYQIEMLLIKFASKNNIPLLGICRGSQSINIYFQGKIKKIANHVRKNHTLKTNFFKNKKITINSYHDYGITEDYLGKNLKALVTTKDGSIELFKHNTKKIMGMMWHPERYKYFRSFELKFIKNFF